MPNSDLEVQCKNQTYLVGTSDVLEDTEESSLANMKTEGRFQRFIDSFKPIERDDFSRSELTSAERAAIATAKSPLKRELKTRHLQMIAIGGAIGTGLFVGSGKALRIGGPGAVLIAWTLTGSMIFAVVQALGELSVAFPVSGSYVSYFSRFVDPSFGFSIAYNYLLNNLITTPLELVAAAITVQYWGVDKKYADGFVALFFVVTFGINMFGVRGYGEVEFILAVIKVITVVGFIILSVVLICGGGPNGDGYVGGKYYHNPGAFAHGFKGFASIFVTSAFAYAGTELFALAAAESRNPRRDIPKAAKQVFWRISIFYILSLGLIGCLVPYTNKKLFAASSVDVTASPFVVAIEEAGIKGLPSVINVVILMAVISVGNSCVYAASRTILALAEIGYLPPIFAYVDRAGRPLVALFACAVFGVISFLAASSKEGDIFNWMLAISGLSTFFTWISVCISHVRFRRGLSVQGRSTDELAFTACCGVWGSLYAIVVITVVLGFQFWTALFPVGGKPSAANFFIDYLSFPVALAFYLAHKIYSRNFRLLIPAKDLDLDTGRRDVDRELLKSEMEAERNALKCKPWYYKVFKFFC